MLDEAYGQGPIEKTQVCELCKRFREGHRKNCFFCTAVHLHIGRRWRKSTLPSMGHPPYSPDLPSPHFLLFLLIKSSLKGRFAFAEEVTAKVTRALTEVSKNGFHGLFPKPLRTL
jgi:hypothetical protein